MSTKSVQIHPNADRLRGYLGVKMSAAALFAMVFISKACCVGNLPLSHFSHPHPL